LACELAVDGGSGRLAGVFLAESDDHDSLSSSRSRLCLYPPFISPLAEAPNASNSVVNCVEDLMNEPRSSATGWYRESGFFRTNA